MSLYLGTKKYKSVQTRAVIVDTMDANAVASDMKEGVIAYVKGQKITGTCQTIPSNSSLTFQQEAIPSMQGTKLVLQNSLTDPTYLESGCNILLQRQEPDIKPENIVEGKTILGVTGTVPINQVYAGEIDPPSDLGKIGDIYIKYKA